MLTVAAMPCLDEEGSVEAACRSLGFGTGSDIEAVLVLVDNGSHDGTLAAMERVAAASPAGAVRIVEEWQTGFVPARHRGAMEALRFAAERGVPADEVLLVQADADTIYLPGYLAAMADGSASAGAGALIEGYSEAEPPSEEFDAYRRFEGLVDDAVPLGLLDDEFDVVVDDKVAALRLSDYFAWGGHRREWGTDGDEILAETTRLCMRGRVAGGRRLRAEAFARTSLRRVLQEPGIAFATAGYPRGPQWKASWRRTYVGPSTVQAFGHGISNEAATQLVRLRVTHLVGLFRLLPAWMAASLGHRDLARDADLLGSPGVADARPKAGAVVDWAMSRAWEDVRPLLEMHGKEVDRAVAIMQA